MQPCEQAPTIQRVEQKVDRIFESLTAIAVQSEQIKVLRDDVNELYGRVRVIETAPTKRLEKAMWGIVGGVGAIAIAYITNLFGG